MQFFKWFLLDCILFSSLRKLKLLSPDPHWICNSKEISGKTQKIVCSSLDLCKLKRASYLSCSSPLIPDPRWVWSKKNFSWILFFENHFSWLEKKLCSQFFFSDGHLKYDNSWNSDSRSFFSPESDTTIHMYYTYISRNESPPKKRSKLHYWNYCQLCRDFRGFFCFHDQKALKKN